MKRYRISFAGAGKVTSGIVPCLLDKGHRILQIYSRSAEKGAVIAKSGRAKWTDKPVFDQDNDIIIVAVSDKSLEVILRELKAGENTIVAHTAGSYGLDIFPASIIQKGVFYPLQTFSEGRNIDMHGVPVFTEASDRKTASVLDDLARSIGSLPVRSSIDNRRLLHVAAVFASNFTNYMLTTGKMISERAGFSEEILDPLIIETINKAIGKGPVLSQTGPAVRNDYNTIEKHLELLSFSPELQTLYEEITRSIINFYKERRENENYQCGQFCIIESKTQVNCW